MRVGGRRLAFDGEIDVGAVPGGGERRGGRRVVTPDGDDASASARIDE